LTGERSSQLKSLSIPSVALQHKLFDSDLQETLLPSLTGAVLSSPKQRQNALYARRTQQTQLLQQSSTPSSSFQRLVLAQRAVLFQASRAARSTAREERARAVEVDDVSVILAERSAVAAKARRNEQVMAGEQGANGRSPELWGGRAESGCAIGVAERRREEHLS
jgi:hypothetical protein